MWKRAFIGKLKVDKRQAKENVKIEMSNASDSLQGGVNGGVRVKCKRV